MERDLPDNTGVGRSPDIGGILTDSIDSITINKTLLPSQDSNGVGGLIEIETKSPLDRPRRFASLGYERTEHGSDFGNEQFFNGTLSGRFGESDDFGVSVSVQFRDQERGSSFSEHFARFRSISTT